MLTKFPHLALSLGILFLLLACSSPARYEGPYYLPLPESVTQATHTVPKSSLDYPGDEPLDAAEIEQWIVVFTNEEREKVSARPLVHNPAVAAIAKAHSENMLQKGETSTILDGKDFPDRAREAGYYCYADSRGGRSASDFAGNVIMNPRVKRWEETSYGPLVSYELKQYAADSEAMARDIVLGWMEDPSTRLILRDPNYRSIGVGVSVYVGQKGTWVLETAFATQSFSSC